MIKEGPSVDCSIVAQFCNSKNKVLSTFLLLFLVRPFHQLFLFQKLIFHFVFFTNPFLSFFERYPQDLASVTLAIAKFHVVFGPHPPWSSRRLIAAEVLRRLRFHRSHQYWWATDDLQHFKHCHQKQCSRKFLFFF